MNPSAFSCHHTTIDTYSYTSAGACYRPYQSCTAYAPTLYQGPSSSTDGWSGECLALGPWSDADQVLFEAFLTSDVTNSSPSGPCTVVPMQPPPYDDQEPYFLHHPTEPTQLHPQPSGDSPSYPHATALIQPTVSPGFKQSPRETTASLISPDLIYPSLHYIDDPKDNFSTSMTFKSPRFSHRFGHLDPSTPPYPSPSPEPSPSAQSPIELAPQQSFPETTCISPDFIYPSAHCDNNLEDDHPTSAKSQSPRASDCRNHPRSSSLPYPSPSPEPSPRTSSIIIASQRRNAPACTAASVSAQSWQCPHCPYVQRNRRSPDLKRHIKTHTRGAGVADWVCCGVPVLNATELGVPAATMREAEVFEFDGVLMVGGCRKTFSRRDALIRHLQREKGRCFGDAQSLYQRGNRESR